MTETGGNRCAHETHQITDVARIEHAEALGQAQSRSIPSQDTMANRVERPRLHPPRQSGISDLTCSPDQFSGGAPAERDKKDPLGHHPILEESGQSAHQCPRFAGTCAGHDE